MREITKKHYNLIEYLHPRIYYPNGTFREIIIGIDGSDGAGKTTLASFISWQFSIRLINLDLFLEPLEDEDEGYIKHNLEQLGVLINYPQNRPVIIEGVFLLEVLEAFDIDPNVLIYISGAERVGELAGLKKYRSKYNPKKKAGFVWK